MEENKLIDHWVVVDEYTELKLKIPERLTSMELQALMHRAKKLFNMSEVSIDAPKTRKVLTPEMIDYALTLSNKGLSPYRIAKKLEEKFNIKPSWATINTLINKSKGAKNGKFK